MENDSIYVCIPCNLCYKLDYNLPIQVSIQITDTELDLYEDL